MRALRHRAVELRVPPPVREDWRDRLSGHLMRLSPESRLNRFFAWMSDEALTRHSARTEPAAIVEARIDGETRGMAEVHLRREGLAEAEIALSVEDGWQRLGIGRQLVEQGVREAQRLGAEEVVLYFLSGNRAMQKIAERTGFRRTPFGDATMVQARLRPARASGAGRGRLH